MKRNIKSRVLAFVLALTLTLGGGVVPFNQVFAAESGTIEVHHEYYNNLGELLPAFSSITTQSAIVGEATVVNAETPEDGFEVVDGNSQEVMISEAGEILEVKFRYKPIALPTDGSLTIRYLDENELPIMEDHVCGVIPLDAPYTAHSVNIWDYTLVGDTEVIVTPTVENPDLVVEFHYERKTIHDTAAWYIDYVVRDGETLSQAVFDFQPFGAEIAVGAPTFEGYQLEDLASDLIKWTPTEGDFIKQTTVYYIPETTDTIPLTMKYISVPDAVEIATPEVMDVVPGETITLIAPEIDGYVPEEEERTVIIGEDAVASEIEFYYYAIGESQGVINVQYKDANTTEIIRSGKNYVQDFDTLITLTATPIDGYTLVGQDSFDVTVTELEPTANIVFWYEAEELPGITGTVTIQPVDGSGNPIAEPVIHTVSVVNFGTEIAYPAPVVDGWTRWEDAPIKETVTADNLDIFISEYYVNKVFGEGTGTVSITIKGYIDKVFEKEIEVLDIELPAGYQTISAPEVPGYTTSGLNATVPIFTGEVTELEWVYDKILQDYTLTIWLQDVAGNKIADDIVVPIAPEWFGNQIQFDSPFIDGYGPVDGNSTFLVNFQSIPQNATIIRTYDLLSEIPGKGTVEVYYVNCYMDHSIKSDILELNLGIHSIPKVDKIVDGKITWIPVPDEADPIQEVQLTYDGQGEMVFYNYMKNDSAWVRFIALDEDLMIIKTLNEFPEEMGDHTYIAPEIPGYELAEEETGTVGYRLEEVGAYETVMIHYVRVATSEDITVTINYEDEDGNVIKEPETDIKPINVRGFYYACQIEGYTLVSEEVIEVAPYVVTEDQSITFVYRAVEDMPDVNVDVFYKDSEGEVIAGYQAAAKVGAEYTATAPELTGYELVGESSKTITVEETGNEIVFIYNKIDDKVYQVINVHYNMINDKEFIEVAPMKVLTQEVGTTVTYSAIQVPGFKIVSDSEYAYTAENADAIDLIFEYEAIKGSITVNYKYGEVLLGQDVISDLELGTTREITAKTFSGYTISDSATRTVTVNYLISDHVVTFHYSKNPTSGGGNGGSGNGGGSSTPAPTTPTPTPEQPNNEPIRQLPTFIQDILSNVPGMKIEFREDVAVRPELPGYIGGYSDGTFRPNNSVSRAEVAQLIFNILDIEAGNNQFSDVKGDDWFAGAVNALANTGIFNGRPDGSFGATDSISRQDFAIALVNIFELEVPEGFGTNANFADIQGAYGQSAIEVLVGLGVIKGYEDGTFRPEASISRAEVVVILNRLFGDFVDSSAIGAEFSDIEGHWAAEEIIKASK